LQKCWKDINKGGRRLRDDPVAKDPMSGKAGNVKPPGGMAYYSGGTSSTSKEGRGLRAWQVPDLHPPKRQGKMSQRGIDIKQATGKSTVRKIEDLFGLPVGADISGTTADQIYFINRFCERCSIQFDPIFYAFPVASLVRPRHHSLVEVGLTLSSVNIINYHIGFYSTLLSENSTHPSAGKIGNVFKKWENHQWNNNILVYFKKDDRIDGGWHFGAPTSDPSYRRLAGVCDHFSDL